MKKILIWVFAVIITVSAAIYQRTTGPTYEREESVTIMDSTFEIELERSSGPRPVRVKIPVNITGVTATLHYKKFKVDEEWKTVDFASEDITYDSWFMTKVMKYENETALTAFMPVQPPAGKLEYYIEISGEEETVFVAKDAPVVIRFKGDVPAYVLIPHIILMFLTMLLATAAGLFAVFKIEKYKRITKWTFWILLFGGFLFGPWVQWHAFGDWWTGVPFGWDLTDNKTLFAFVFWIAAFIGNRKKSRPGLVILAAIMTLVIFSIPHSLFGSELDYASGEISQG